MSEKRRLRLDCNREAYAICPKCHKRMYYVEGQHTTTDKLYPTGTDKLEWATDNHNSLRDSYRFLCPECHKVIAVHFGKVFELFLEPAQEQEVKIQGD